MKSVSVVLTGLNTLVLECIHEVKEFRKLIFSWEWKSEPGVESLVTIELTPEGDHTLMQFEHSHVGNRSMHNYLTGWTMTFEKLNMILIQK